MSGSTIGGVAGGLIGFVVSGFNPLGAQMGFVIGSAVGAAIDPVKTSGPRLTDARAQTSNEGVARTIVYGTCAVSGNIMQIGPLVEHKKTETQGKGGPKVTTYTYTRTVAIRISEAAPLGGTMRLIRVWKDDKLVYDVSPANTIPADTAKFASILTFYTGAEDQLPDPSLEALPAENGGGMGNVPAYVGTCYVVLTDLDCTDRGGSVSQFRWEVASDAASDEIVTSRYVPVDYARFTNDPNSPLTHPFENYTVMSAAGNKLVGGGFTVPLPATVQDCIDYAGAVAYPAWGSPTHFMGIMRGGGGPYSPSNSDAMIGHGPFYDMSNYKRATLIYNWVKPDAFQDGVRLIGDNFGSPSPTGGAWNADCAGMIFRSYTVRDTTTSSIRAGYEGFNLLSIDIRANAVVPQDRPQEGEFLIPDAPGYVSDADGNMRKLGGTATFVAGSFRALALDDTTTSSITYGTRETGPILPSTDPNYNVKAFWDAEYEAAVDAGTMPAGKTYSATGNGGTGTYPRNKTGAYSLSSGATTVVTAGKVSLPAIIGDLASRAGIPASQLDLTALAGMEVRGYPVARETTADAAALVLMQVFFFELPEWGNSGDDTTKLRAVLRGGASVLTLTDDDLADDGTDELTRPQQIEFPRKILLSAPDPDANYEPATEAAERESENIKALGESKIDTSVVLSRDENAVIVEKLLKTGEAESVGRIDRTVPRKFSQYTPSDCLTYQGKRYRIDRAETHDTTIQWKLVRDRISAASSTASGAVPLPPTPPVSNVRGRTMFSAMNTPRLRSQDSTPGMYVGVSGLLPGWIGCDLYLSVDDGVTEQLVASIPQASTMGVLTATLAVAGDPLYLNLYDGELDSATPEQLLVRKNAAAITTGGITEILQFQTVVDEHTLTTLTRGLLGTTEAVHYEGDSFVLLDTGVVFIPIDIGLAGKTLIFRPVSIGTVPANNETYSVVFQPKFTGPQVVEAYTDDAGNIYTDDAGNTYYYEVPSL